VGPRRHDCEEGLKQKQFAPSRRASALSSSVRSGEFPVACGRPPTPRIAGAGLEAGSRRPGESPRASSSNIPSCAASTSPLTAPAADPAKSRVCTGSSGKGTDARRSARVSAPISAHEDRVDHPAHPPTTPHESRRRRCGASPPARRAPHAPQCQEGGPHQAFVMRSKGASPPPPPPAAPPPPAPRRGEPRGPATGTAGRVLRTHLQRPAVGEREGRAQALCRRTSRPWPHRAPPRRDGRQRVAEGRL